MNTTFTPVVYRVIMQPCNIPMVLAPPDAQMGVERSKVSTTGNWLEVSQCIAASKNDLPIWSLYTIKIKNRIA